MVKQATKGQKEIYEENQKTVTTYSVASTVSMAVYYSSCMFLSQCSSSDYIFFALSALIQIAAILFMKSLASKYISKFFFIHKYVTEARLDEKGHVLDAGADLNDPEAFGEYCKDAIILTVITQVVSLYSTYGFLLLLAFPAAATYKFVMGFLFPWLTAGSDSEDVDDKKQKKMDRRREKVTYRR
ncbi:Protein CBG12511 [Caenorhabditis briggsae]|uniref:Transmembrane protein 208 n=1 Tax=Caenorhabditis briggsae TaxID=6238 RepID=A8XFY0_CAEBR|nr:Protein CBG12511 [Caenorhabditis briggsae]CAP31484.2 Protein CBG12511 [Caenorhabditis briggsae]